MTPPISTPDADADEAILLVEPDLPLIDSHHHLWDRPGDRYLLEALTADLASGHLVLATVYMECGSGLHETGPAHLRPVGEVQFAASMAAQAARGLPVPTRVCAGIVGAADFSLGAAVDEVLDALALAGDGRLRGIRGSAAWDADALINPGGRPNAPRGLLLDKQFRAGFARLAGRDLIYEAWQYFPQLSELCDLADTFPQVPIVVNHCGGLLGIGAYAAPDNFDHWKAQVAAVAQRPNTFMKLGGLARRRCGFDLETRATPPTARELARLWRPYIATCVDLFGPERCLVGSNFPPDRVAGSYRTLWNALKLCVADGSQSEKETLFHRTAARLYRLAPQSG